MIITRAPMKIRTLPDQKYLQECFDYNPHTGILVWGDRPAHHFKTLTAFKTFNKRSKGKAAGSMNGHGRRVVSVIKGEQFIAARVIWKMVTGDDPPDFIDHENQIKDDNRWSNLRAATKAQNEYNTGARKNSKTGYKNVCFSSREKLYRAYITKDRKQYHLGYYPSPELAHAAVVAATPTYHGAFSYTT